MSKQINGFTLLELLIVIVIIGILAGIAYPSYQKSILKSRRADALATLSQDQIILERCYAQNFSYSNCPSLPASGHISSQGYYTISITTTPSTYIITATPRNTQIQDTTCNQITVNQSNERTAKDSAGNSQDICWHA